MASNKKREPRQRMLDVFGYEWATGFCEKHGAFNALAVCGKKAYCPKCVEEKRAATEKAEAEQARLVKLLHNIDGLPARYKDAGFLNFVKTPANMHAFEKVLAFAKNPRDTWLLLLGKNGTGKTHLAQAALKLTGGIYREFDDIANEFLDMQDGIGIGRVNLIKKYSLAPLLVIDEVDKVKSTEGRIGWLNTILRNRYNNFLPVILCGNINSKALCKQLDLNGGEAIADRITEVGEVILFDWESYRNTLRTGGEKE